MELLQDFLMPQFTRTIWVSPEAKLKWAQHIKAIAQMYFSLEFLSVVHGLRHAFVTYFSPELLPAETAKFARLGLFVFPVKQIESHNSFANFLSPVKPGKPWKYHCVVARKLDDAISFSDAISRADDISIGEILGYPKCCREHFAEFWKQKYIDPIWQIAQNSVSEGGEIINQAKNQLHVHCLAEINPLLRYIGVRLTPHISHSFSCRDSIELAKSWIALGEQEGFGNELVLAKEILSWPIEWSVLHGIAEIRTPFFKISTSSMPTSEKWVVRLDGNYPANAPNGLVFPYNAPRNLIKKELAKP